jgi:hypothetical protein
MMMMMMMMMIWKCLERNLASSQKMGDLKFVEGDVEGLCKLCFRDGSS